MLLGKTIVVTGISSGIGARIGQLAEALGADVIGVDVRDPARRLDAFIRADLGSSQGVAEIAAAARKAVDDRRRMADDCRRSLMAEEEAKRFRSYCLARKRSEKAKGRAEASPREAATLRRPSAPQRLARAGSSTTPLHLSRWGEGLRPEDQGRRADGLPAACRLLRRRSRCRLFPLWRDYSANSTRRGMAALAASLTSRIHRGERDKIDPVDTAQQVPARRR